MQAVLQSGLTSVLLVAWRRIGNISGQTFCTLLSMHTTAPRVLQLGIVPAMFGRGLKLPINVHFGLGSADSEVSYSDVEELRQSLWSSWNLAEKSRTGTATKQKALHDCWSHGPVLTVRDWVLMRWLAFHGLL